METPVFHTMMDFTIPTSSFEKIRQPFLAILKQFAEAQADPVEINTADGSLAILVGSHQVTLRFFNHGLVTVDIMAHSKTPFPAGKADYMRTTNSLGQKLEHSLKELGVAPQKNPKVWTPVTRGGHLDPFLPTTDNRIIEYDFTKILFQEDSPFQNIKLFESTQFGPVLILDDDVNMSASDARYTQAIMGDGTEDFKDKDVLILGGGDGHLLNQMRKQNPKQITMLEIDQLVLNAAKTHLRSLCEDSLDTGSGENFKIIMGDCTIALAQFLKEGRTFDYIINDLTAIPVGENSESLKADAGDWDLLRTVLDYGMKLLAPKGIYLAQGNGQLNFVELEMYEEILRKLPTPVDWVRIQDVWVPSYQEKWVFFKIWKK